MMNQKMIEILREADVIFDESILNKKLELLNDFQKLKLHARLLALFSISNDSKGDYDAKREAYRVLRHILKEGIIDCLLDDDKLFVEMCEKSKMTADKAIEFSLISALAGSKKIAEYLFNTFECSNPKNNSYFISYAICSGENEWVKEIIEKWKVDIKNKKYCFYTYAIKFNNQDLIDFYRRFPCSQIENKSTFFTSDKIFSDQKPKLLKIPDPIAEAIENSLLGLKEIILEEFNKIEQRIILSLITDSNLSISQVVSCIEEMEEESSLGRIFSNSVWILCCSLNPSRWQKLTNRNQADLLDNLVAACLRSESTEWNEEELKIRVKQLFSHHTYQILKPLIVKKSDLDVNENLYREKLISQSEIIKNNDLLLKGMQEEAFIDDYFKTLINELKTIMECKTKKLGVNIRNKTDLSTHAPIFYELNISHPVWKLILGLLVENIPQLKKQSEGKTLNFVKTILFKESKNCKWGDLPKWSPPIGEVYFYYKEWQKMGLLYRIHQFINDQEKLEIYDRKRSH